eukprot:TRINITY_DN10664_c0_g3_i1.p1 TRINITY_DN10664_c0_g3~~TRINITY_DN10664_c0_g3_i1.p1  ORF type:complete len:269 (+),score=75.95 TRINITY_DN10664_c0_g3_i1:90-896(+)
MDITSRRGPELWEGQALQEEFSEAVKYVGTSPGLMLSEAIQRRLFGLYTRASSGVPPTTVPKGMHKEQWEAWSDAAELSDVEAMQEYLGLLSRNDPDWLLSGDSSMGLGALGKQEQPLSELPPEMRAQLEAAGIKEAASSTPAPRQDNIWNAAVNGKSLERFLPDQKDAKCADGITALMYAVDSERLDQVDELLLARASPDLVDPQGATALHYAALLGNEVAADRLIAACADPRIKDEDGATPADVARSEGHKELAKKLDEALAKFQG